MSSFPHHRIATFLLILSLGPITAPAEDIRFPTNSGVINIKSAPYLAVGDGIANDTAAFQAALADSTNVAGRTLYIPNGTYLLTNTVSWPGDGGVNITLQGQSQTGTVLRLPDSTPGFTNAAAPRVLLDGKGNDIPQRFANSLRNLTVDTGTGNTGAIAVQYYANNMGACRDVTLRGSGFIGLEMSHARANGPCLVVNTTIDGFQYGVRTGYAMESLVFENITLRNQSALGWWNENASRTTTNGYTHLPASQTLSIRRLTATNLSVPAFRTPSGHVVLIDSVLSGTGAASTIAAIENGASGQLLLRNVSAPGYARVVRDDVTNIPGTHLVEWLSNPITTQFVASATTLNLPIQETPDVPVDDPSTWANIKSFGATDWNVGEGSRFDNDAPAIQAAIDSGASTVFVPAGFFRVLSEIKVRGNVRRIMGVGGASSVGAGNNASGVAYTGIVWNVVSGTNATVVLENMSTGYANDATGVDNQSSRTLVLRDILLQPPRFTGPGDIFVENVVASNWRFNGQRCWARQLDIERDGDHIVSRGATLWVLGLKTEDFGLILDASGGARTEILGGMIYSLDDATGTPMIRNAESYLSFSLMEYLGFYGKTYTNLVEETAQGITRTLNRLAPGSTNLALPARWSQNIDGTTSATNGPVGSQILLYSGASTVSLLTLQGNGTGIPDNAASPSLANHTSFGNVQASGGSLARTYTFVNGATNTVTFTGVPRVAITGTHAADFSVLTNLPTSLTGTSSVSFQVLFTPGSTGTRTATLSVSNSATADGAHSFAVSGNGTGPAPDINFVTTGLTTTVVTGTASNVPFTINNPGLGGLSASPVVPSQYTFSTKDHFGGPAYEWIEIISGDNAGTRLTFLEGQDDARTGTYDLGFAFPFYGTNYTRIRVHSNGYLELGNSAASDDFNSSFGNGPLPTIGLSPTNALVVPYWDDLYFVKSTPADSTDSRAYVRQIDANTFVVTYSSVSFYTTALRTKRMTFQVILKRSGEIRFQYQFLDNDSSCTVGIQQSPANALQVLNNTSGTRLSSGFALRIAPPPAISGVTWLTALTPTNLVVGPTNAGLLTLPISAVGIATGLTGFTQVRIDSNATNKSPAYLPVTLVVAGAPTNAVPAPSNLTATATAGPTVFLTWSDPATNETGFLVERSVSLGGPYAALVTTPANTTNHTDVTVEPATTYHYRVTTLASPQISAPSATASLTTVAPTPIQTWRLQHFGSALNAGPGADGADGDADGLVNLVEYVAGGTPRGYTPAPIGGVVTVGTTNFLALTTPVSLGATDVVLTAESATDLSGPWTNAVLHGSAAAGTQTYGFNQGQADFNARFLETLVGNVPPWDTSGVTNSGGVANSGCLQGSTFNQAALWSDGFVWPAGATLELSVRFRARVDANTVGGQNLRLGFDASPAGQLNGGQYLAVSVEQGTVAGTGQLSVIGRESTTVTTKTGTNLPAMVDQRWYELVGRFTKLTPATNQFQVEVRLYDWGTNGITGGTLVGTNFVVNATGAASGLPTLWADSDVYAGFRAAVASGSGTRFLDDFTLPQDTITFRDGMPMDGTPRRFIRLRISSP